MDAVTELFKHANPLGWVIGSITLIVIAVLAVNRKIFSENKLFSLVLVAILLIVTVYLFSPSSDRSASPPSAQAADSAGQKEEVTPPPPRNTTTTDPPKLAPSVFTGTWKNTNLNTKRFTRLIFSGDSPQNTWVKVYLNQYDLVGNFKTTYVSAHELRISEITYNVSNRYQGVRFVFGENGIVSMYYDALLSNGSQQKNLEDQFSKE